jgi:hypothetical protein
VELFSATLCARVLFSSLSFLLFFPSYVSAELTAPTSDSRRVVRGPALCVVVTPHRVDARAQAGVMPEDPGWGFAGDHEDRAADDGEAVRAAHPFRALVLPPDLRFDGSSSPAISPSPGVHSAPWEKCKAAT